MSAFWKLAQVIWIFESWLGLFKAWTSFIKPATESRSELSVTGWGLTIEPFVDSDLNEELEDDLQVSILHLQKHIVLGYVIQNFSFGQILLDIRLYSNHFKKTLIIYLRNNSCKFGKILKMAWKILQRKTLKKPQLPTYLFKYEVMHHCSVVHERFMS